MDGQEGQRISAPIMESLEPWLLLSGSVEEQALTLFSVSPALFAENQGQWAEESVRFVHDGAGANIAMTDTGPVFQIFRTVDDGEGSEGEYGLLPVEPAAMEVLQFSASFVGSNAVIPVGLEQSETVFNYHLGDDASRWREGVPTYEMVAYEDLYEGIDLQTWGLRSHLKYEFHVAPGADYSQIAIRYDGIDGLSIGADGSLIVDLGDGWEPLIDDAPIIYQEIDGEQIDVAGRFVLLDEDSYSFEITGAFDASRELIIDPYLAWSTYVGGTGMEDGWDIALDDSGCIYVTGRTLSSTSWVSGGFDTTYNGGGTTGSGDAYVVKLTPSGEHAWSTYMGGTLTDHGLAIAVDASGGIVVAGFTSSEDWVSGGYDTSQNGDCDAFVAKLSSTGGHVWSTYLGGSDTDEGNGIAVDDSGCIYVVGRTESEGWVSGGFDTSYNGGDWSNDGDAFVVKLTSNGDHAWSTYLGGSHGDGAYGVAVGGSNEICVTGFTCSPGWVSGGFDTTLDGEVGGGGWPPPEAFAANLTTAGGHIWSTYLGGSNNDNGYGIAVDDSGNIVVTGSTKSSGWVSGGFDTSYDGGTSEGDAFVVKLTSTGGHAWSTYLGGDSYQNETGRGITTDSSGAIYVTGYTASPGWVSGGPDVTYAGGWDAFVVKLTSAGSHSWSTYLGDVNHDKGHGIVVNHLGDVYVTGNTGSEDWISGGYDTTFNGGGDAFVAKMTLQLVGDADGDGKLDTADIAAWQQNYDPAGVNENTWAMGDWDGDGEIDDLDSALWSQNYDPLGNGWVEPPPLSGDAAIIHVRVETDKAAYLPGETVHWTIYAWVETAEGTDGISLLGVNLHDDRGETLNPADTELYLGMIEQFTGTDFGAVQGFGWVYPGLVDPANGGLIDIHAGDSSPDSHVSDVGEDDGTAPYPLFCQGSYLVNENGVHTLSVTVNAANFWAGSLATQASGFQTVVVEDAAFCVGIPGDANDDGKVDSYDLAQWQIYYDPIGDPDNTWEMGDWNDDDRIDSGDLALWQQNYDPIGGSKVGAEPLASDGPGTAGNNDVGASSNGGIEYILSGVPSYEWRHGCGPTAAGMVMGYWDGLAYPQLITGDASTQTMYVDQRIASDDHVDDYALYDGVDDHGWIYFDMSTWDPRHAHDSDSLADFMMTSWSSESACYQLTWPANVGPGMEDYAEWCGLDHTRVFRSDPNFAQYCTILGEGRPVVLGVDSDADGIIDHYATGVGYRTGLPGHRQIGVLTTDGDDVEWFDWRAGTVPAGHEYSVYSMWDFQPSYGYPDLVPVSSSLNKVNMLWGEGFNYDFTLRNVGSEDAWGFYISFYLSSNSDISTADHLLERWYVGLVESGDEYHIVKPLSLPSAPPAGFTQDDDVYVGIIIDAEDYLEEGSESNNSNFGEGIDKVSLAVSNHVDLYGTAMSIDAPVINVIDPTVTFTVENSGYTTSGSFYVYFYLSEDAYIDPAADTYVGLHYVSNIAAYGDYTADKTLTLIPSTDPFGSGGVYYIGMVVDRLGQVAERNEYNNAGWFGVGFDMVEAAYGMRIFRADFERGDGAMVIENSNPDPSDANWHVTTHRGGDAGHTGTHSMYYGIEGEWDYDSGHTYGAFTTKTIWLPDDPAILTFNHFLDTEVSNLYDLPKVSIYEVMHDATTVLLQKYLGLPYHTGGAWEQVVVDLTPYAGKMVKLSFSFDTVDALSNSDEGWYVDDIHVWTTYNPMTPSTTMSMRRDGTLRPDNAELIEGTQHRLFAFVENQKDGSFNLSASDLGAGVNAAMAVYDGETGEMLFLDDNSGQGPSPYCSIPNYGLYNRYIVEVWDLEGDTAGDLDVMVSGTQSFAGNGLQLDGQGRATAQGQLGDEQETVYYTLTSPFEGVLNLRVKVLSGGFYPRLQVWRGGEDVFSGLDAGGHVRLENVYKGETFEIALSSHNARAQGAYALSASVLYDDPSSFEGAVWYDANVDHLYNPQDEQGLAGWMVWLDLNDDGQWQTGEPNDSTAQDGTYIIDGVDPGLYRVRCVDPNGNLPESAWHWSRPAAPGTYLLGISYDQTFQGVDFGLILVGDADGDGKVDSADLAIWQSNYDPIGSNPDNDWSDADFNEDGYIDSSDLAIWQQFYNPLGVLGSKADSLERSGGPSPDAGTWSPGRPAVADEMADSLIDILSLAVLDSMAV